MLRQVCGLNSILNDHNNIYVGIVDKFQVTHNYIFGTQFICKIVATWISALSQFRKIDSSLDVVQIV